MASCRVIPQERSYASSSCEPFQGGVVTTRARGCCPTTAPLSGCARRRRGPIRRAARTVRRRWLTAKAFVSIRVHSWFPIASIRERGMNRWREGLRQLRQHPSAVAGAAIIAVLVLVSVYTVIAIPYGEAIERWRGGMGPRMNTNGHEWRLVGSSPKSALTHRRAASRFRAASSLRAPVGAAPRLRRYPAARGAGGGPSGVPPAQCGAAGSQPKHSCPFVSIRGSPSHQSGSAA